MIFLVGHQPEGIETGDLNNDNKPDIVTANQDTTISILTNNSTAGGFNFIVQDIVIGTIPRAVAISDIDGDTRPDLAIAGSEVNISILQNTSMGNNLSFAPKVNFYMAGSQIKSK